MFGPYLRFLPILALSACGFHGQDIGNPVTRNLRWFSYVSGDDLKSACQPGAPDQYRLVYNADYETQIRAYDIDSARKLLITHVRAESGNLMNAAISDPFGPWRTTEARPQLNNTTYDNLISALQNDGAFGPSPEGMRLNSHNYYWTAASCHKGQFSFVAWAYPSPAFSALTFDRLVFENDTTNIPVEQAKPSKFDPAREDERRRGRSIDFTLEVGTHGLVK